jgi:hypothetical protein
MQPPTGEMFLEGKGAGRTRGNDGGVEFADAENAGSDKTKLSQMLKYNPRVVAITPFSRTRYA